MSDPRAERARAKFKERRRRMRERGDYSYDTLEREHQEERRQFYEEEERRGACCCHGEPDVIPPRPVRVFGWLFFLAFFFGAMIFMGVRVGWWAPLMLIACVCVVLLPSTIEFMCRGNRVLKHDRGSFFFWW